YGGRSAAELVLERRRRLIDAGLELFATRGYLKTQIELICAESRVTTRHFYEQFNSREALLAAVFEEAVLHLGDTVRRSLRRAPDLAPTLRIANAIRALARASTRYPRRSRIICIETVGVSPEMEQRRRTVIHEFAQAVEVHAQRLAQAGELPQRNYHLSCVAMVGALIALVTEWLTAENPPSAQVLSDELLSLFQAIVLGAQAHVPDLMRGRRLTARK
ncbi:MAG: TetR/AcrR family transcriptional regulator, partial [Stenotrophobium sp.]